MFREASEVHSAHLVWEVLIYQQLFWPQVTQASNNVQIAMNQNNNININHTNHKLLCHAV